MSKKLKILVSGSTGQLGRELSQIAHQYPQFDFVFRDRQAFDLGDKHSISKNLDRSIDFFINAGAYTAVDKAERESDLAYKINSKALENIGQSASSHTRIIHISTDYVYHSLEYRPLRESDPVSPKGVYAKSKRSGEELLANLRPDAYIIRTSWVYSSFGNNFVKTMLRLGREKDTLGIVEDQKGSPTYARDLAAVILMMIQESPDPGIYNYSNTGYTDWAGFARTIFRLAQIECKVNGIATGDFGAPAPRPSWSVMSKQKIINALDIDIPGWEESLEKCLAELGYPL